MRQYTFNVKFAGGTSQTVTAFTEDEAIILAQALQIKAAHVWRQVIDIYTIE